MMVILQKKFHRLFCFFSFFHYADCIRTVILRCTVMVPCIPEKTGYSITYPVKFGRWNFCKDIHQVAGSHVVHEMFSEDRKNISYNRPVVRID